jgi:hypothetical protein
LSACSLIFVFVARLSSEAAFDHPVWANTGYTPNRPGKWRTLFSLNIMKLCSHSSVCLLIYHHICLLITAYLELLKEKLKDRYISLSVEFIM